MFEHFDSPVRRSHHKTSSPLPLEVEEASFSGESAKDRLFRYLGGGLRDFRATRGEILRERRQGRFLAFAAAVFAFWLIFMFI